MPKIHDFAKALFALHQSNILKNKNCKEPVKSFIRQASETTYHHATTHYRSREVAKCLKGMRFGGIVQYHKFCSSEFRHEHVVPVEVIYQMLIGERNLTLKGIEDILREFSIRATITAEEDAKLLKSAMPEEFWDKESNLYMDPMARYKKAGISGKLVKRSNDTWVE